MTTNTLAFVGAAGGVGTTRVTLECATLLAGEGRDVAVLDAAYVTQGLTDRTSGRIEPDATALCLDGEPLSAGLVEHDVEGAGRLAVCPARAPFERLARAKTPEAARAFGDLIAEANRAFDHVLVDAPPVAANQAVAAVTSVEEVAVVCDADRAGSAVPRLEDRLADVGAPEPTCVITCTDDHADADVTVPTLDADWPATEADEAARDALAGVVETTVGVEIEPGEETGIRSRLPI